MSNLVLPEPPPSIRPLTDEQLNWLRQRHSDLPVSLADCVTCSGRKTFQFYVPGQREEIATYDCRCADQFLLNRAFLYAGVGVNYQRLGWDDFADLPENIRGAAADYLAKNDDFVHAGIGIIAHGSMGNGKSLFGNLLMKALISYSHDGFVTTFNELLQTLQGGWKDKEERMVFHRRVKNAGVLMIDDLGRESKREILVGKEEAETTGKTVGRHKITRSWTETSFEEIIRHRVANSKPTFITTNVGIDRIEECYGGHVLSLLRERSVVIPFTGADYRSDMKTRLLSEVSRGIRRPVVIG